MILSEVESIDPVAKRVALAKDQRALSYDFLIIATGTHIAPEQTPGLLEHEWQKSIFDFYTADGAVALHKFLRTWPGGRLVLNVTEMPIKCPVAPLEFLFLADAFFQERGMPRQGGAGVRHAAAWGIYQADRQPRTGGNAGGEEHQVGDRV